MSDYMIRDWAPEDRPALKALWKQCFGDSEEYIDSFFGLFLQPGRCLVAEADSRPVSAMYILPDIQLFPHRKEHLTAGYAYALATLPEYRGRGIGTAVFKAVSDRILETADAACVLPAEAGLYPFYEDAVDAKPVSFLRQARFTRDELRRFQPCGGARIPTLEYAAIREQLLHGYPHASYDQEIYDLLEADGCDFLVTANGLAAAETVDGVCRVTELLDPTEDVMSSIACVARWCPAKEYIVRTPLFFEGPGEARPFMLGALREQPAHPMSDELWWGFGLD